MKWIWGNTEFSILEEDREEEDKDISDKDSRTEGIISLHW